jgi:hypothetical protein
MDSLNIYKLIQTYISLNKQGTGIFINVYERILIKFN